MLPFLGFDLLRLHADSDSRAPRGVLFRAGSDIGCVDQNAVLRVSRALTGAPGLILLLPSAIG